MGRQLEKITDVIRNILALGLAALLASCVGTPHSSANEISALEVSVYKSGIGMGCRNQGKSLGHPPEQVEHRCACVMEVLNGHMSEEDWRNATFFAQQKRDRDEARVLAPHMAAVRECK
jgi:hypothetical protein